ncbi:methylisocitrate lyase [Corynebacterium pollutisoli]|uniref:Methylisocitrate lyase n=1 Tax=Corynebacterium pollutisoli TaxID=1610489 RepID=A0A1X7JD23_9CORY|nr:methylisocitrate lyase [Corynebacterium pollutisoli]NLP38851.1 methylisocitrate lyase [Corynebacterium pollutisoli]SMG24992.1 methylisocitrate lyase [Corynebacterium pollutisoli]HJD79323.1 methylisocitrate lyase [Corynebacterium pollutisoli]
MAGLFSSTVTPTERRQAFRDGLNSGKIQKFPGAFSPLVARAIQEAGFEGVYVSGAVVAADLALPDIGLTTLTEVAHRSRQIARVTDLPVLVDADTGFGEPMSAARTISEFEDAGVAGCHLEDQVNPKRCGHLDGKEVVPTELMLRRITAAVNERRDDQFVICARTDAAGVEGIDSAIERAKAYADAGADLIFTEALHTPADFEKFRAAVDVPLLANMTEFGKSELLSAKQLEDLGFNAVIYPVTTLRIAMGQVEEALAEIAATGTQTGWVDRMQHRSRLYELLRYNEYNAFDQEVFTYSADTYQPTFQN